MVEDIQVRRAKKDDIAAIVALVREATESAFQIDEAEVMDWLFGKGLWVATCDGALVGVVAYQTENLVSVTDVFYVSPAKLWARAGRALLDTIEAEVSTLMCEANVILLSARTSGTVRALLQEEGYEAKTLSELHRIWREVLGEFDTEEKELMVKRLRERMVMVPI